MNTDLLIFRGSVKKPRREKMHENSLRNLIPGNVKSQISENTRKKITRIIENWVDTVNWAKSTGRETQNFEYKNFGMLTLTLPAEQQHDDRLIKRVMLMIFIKELKKNYKNLQYIWKAETQENGNIHFHIVLDTYVPIQLIDKLWQNRCKKLGYYQKFKEKFPEKEPPATNIESLRRISRTAAYITKYMTKNDDRRPVLGRVWGCSDSLKNLDQIECSVTETELDYMLSFTKIDKDYSIINENFCILRHLTAIDLLHNYALTNYYYENSLFHNFLRIYEIEQVINFEDPQTEWEKDVIAEAGPIMASYLYNNQLLEF